MPIYAPERQNKPLLHLSFETETPLGSTFQDLPRSSSSTKPTIGAKPQTHPLLESLTGLNQKPRSDRSGAGQDHELCQYIRG